jgi:hypothetical protein
MKVWDIGWVEVTREGKWKVESGMLNVEGVES